MALSYVCERWEEPPLPMLIYPELKGRRFSSTTTSFYQESFFAFL
jgi:hypothetical protein